MVNVDIYNETHDWKIVSGAPCNEDDANNIMPQRLVMIFSLFDNPVFKCYGVTQSTFQTRQR